MTTSKLWLFGAPRLEQAGESIEVDTRKAIALLAYLALQPETHRRDALAAMFWPESDQSRARSALRRTLSALNKALAGDWSIADRENLQLNSDWGLWVDVQAFRSRLASCRTHGHPDIAVCPDCLPPLNEAVALHRGDFMAGFSLRDSPEFDDWQRYQAEGLRQGLATALKKVVSYHVERQAFDPAIDAARRWLALDPLHEPAHRHLMRLYAWAGQRSAALRQYQELVRLLEEELGAFPLDETIELYERIRERRPLPPPAELDTSLFEAVGMGGETAVAAEPAAAAPSHNLPRQSTPFVGREAELADIGGLLARSSCRLLTLIGPGGIGKTRLALQAATNALDQFSHGAFFVPVTAGGTPDHLVSTIAEALRFDFYGREARPQQLFNYLREKQMLLLLDNFEEMGDRVDLVAELLEAAPHLKLLVTSQERLNLQDEWLYEVGGLAFPRNGQRHGAEDFSAVQLFLQRARKVAPDFTLTAEEQPAVARICQLVSGMPLGVELAAAWVRMLPPADIAREIENSLDFLATSLRDVPDRHRSLRAVFDHSWRLLTPQERTVFRQLAVFRGGFRREAAQQVAGAALPLLLSLANKSFLRRSSSGRGDLRYDVPAVLGQYAAETLAEAEVDGDLTAAHERHASYYTTLLAEREAALRGGMAQEAGDQKQALDEIAEEIDNIRAAWRWSIGHHRFDLIAGALGALYRFYEMRSWFEEGERMFAAAVNRLGGPVVDPEAVDSPMLGRLLARYGRFAMRLWRTEQALDRLETALAILQRFDDAAGEVAPTLSNLGIVWEALGDVGRAREYQEQSLALARQLDDRLGTAHALLRLGNLAINQGEYGRARDYYEEGRKMYAAINYQRGIALCLNNLGGVADKLGDYRQSRRLYEASLTIKRELGERRGIALSLNNMGFIAYLQGELTAAAGYLAESAAIFKEIGDRRGLAYAYNNLANVSRGEGEFVAARQRNDQAMALFRAVGDQVGLAFSQIDLGRDYQAEGDHRAALAEFRAGVGRALEVQAVPVVLEGLASLAASLAAVGQVLTAVEILGQVLHHEASGRETEKQAHELLAGLAAQLPEAELAAAQGRGAERPLAAIVRDFLAGAG